MSNSEKRTGNTQRNIGIFYLKKTQDQARVQYPRSCSRAHDPLPKTKTSWYSSSWLGVSLPLEEGGDPTAIKAQEKKQLRETAVFPRYRYRYTHGAHALCVYAYVFVEVSCSVVGLTRVVVSNA